MLFRSPSYLPVILVALLNVVTFRTCFGDVNKDLEVPGFIYLGSYMHTVSLLRSSLDTDFYHYYVSQGSASWSEATRDCKARFAADSNLAGLLSFSSSDELTRIVEMVTNRFPGPLGHWTSGIYHKFGSKWIWATNKEEVPSWVPWKGGAPPNNADSSSRLILTVHNEVDFVVEADKENAARRYICKRAPVVKPTIPPMNATVPVVPCYKTVDLELILDSSGSVMADNFKIALEYIANLTAAFTVHNKSRIGYSTYSNDVIRYISLNNTLSPEQIRQTILASKYTEGGTYTHTAIDDAVASLETNKRPSIPRAMVVVTDGVSENPLYTALSSMRAQKLSIEMYCVGISQPLNETELLILGGNVPGHVFHAYNWNDLIPLLTETSVQFCPK